MREGVLLDGDLGNTELLDRQALVVRCAVGRAT
jgi:hypothetical protein